MVINRLWVERGKGLGDAKPVPGTLKWQNANRSAAEWHCSWDPNLEEAACSCCSLKGMVLCSVPRDWKLKSCDEAEKLGYRMQETRSGAGRLESYLT